MSDDLLRIVTPVFNEGANFPQLYEAVNTQIKTPFEMLVVYDFDGDDTVPVAREIAAKDGRVKLLKNTLGRGVLNAMKAGFAAVESGPCLVIMADLSDDLTQVDRMVELYEQGASVVCGSRYMKGGSQVGGPKFKQFLSRMAGTSLFYIRRFPTHDVTNNFKLYDTALLKRIRIESQGGFEIAMEITVKAFKLKLKIVEIPTTWKDRTAGQSNFRIWKWLPSYLRWYFYAFFGNPARR